MNKWQIYWIIQARKSFIDSFEVHVSDSLIENLKNQNMTVLLHYRQDLKNQKMTFFTCPGNN